METKIENSMYMWGAQNTRLFHLSTIIRCKRNKIERLKINNSWCNDASTIASHIRENYCNLFKKDINVELSNLVFPNMPKLNDSDNGILNMDINAFEIKAATFSMKG